MTVNQIARKSNVLAGDRNHYFTIYYNIRTGEPDYEEFIGNGYIELKEDVICIGNICQRTSAKVLQNMINAMLKEAD